MLHSTNLMVCKHAGLTAAHECENSHFSTACITALSHCMQARRLLPMEAELAAPMWVFGQKPYHVLRDGRILAVFSDPKEAGEACSLQRRNVRCMRC